MATDKLKYIPYGLFSAYMIKLLIVGSSIQDALILLGMMALVAFFEYKPALKEIIQLKQELQVVKDDLSAIRKGVDEAKTSIVGMKLTQGLRQPNTPRI